MEYSVVIPIYNRESTVSACVRSVREQTLSPEEVILVDDGSTDRSVEVALGSDPSIKVISTNGRCGACAARNLGASHARSEWVAFQDSDDVWLPQKQESNCRIAQDLQTDVVFGPFISFRDGKRTIEGLPADPSDRQRDCVLSQQSLRALLHRNCISTQTLMLKKDTLESVGGFNTRLKRFQDWDLAIRLAARGPIGFAHQPQVVVEQQSDSISRNFDAGLDSRYHFLSAYAERYRRDPQAASRMWRSIAIREAMRIRPSLTLAATKHWLAWTLRSAIGVAV